MSCPFTPPKIRRDKKVSPVKKHIVERSPLKVQNLERMNGHEQASVVQQIRF